MVRITVLLPEEIFLELGKIIQIKKYDLQHQHRLTIQ